MFIKQIEYLRERLIEKGQKLLPFTIEKVEKLESLYQVKLPAVYRNFLLSMGNGAGKYMQGSSENQTGFTKINNHLSDFFMDQLVTN